MNEKTYTEKDMGAQIKDKYIATAACGIGGLIAGIVLGAVTVGSRGSYIPCVDEVQEGYIAPAHIGIRTEDYDRNSGRETVATIDGVDYLLKYDSENRPTLNEFSVEPARIVDSAVDSIVEGN